ncbi:hypothetical protein CEXT_11101 [Caerostris extrusa]|uniref:Uncharacterized protein n=1 Tax=Caerostris extrusa TaxID=172846 RepID=A0AAV4QEZ6_CAEEX|nr:hypothetical protein CEXT_11101 [Caerostris extrusa]
MKSVPAKSKIHWMALSGSHLCPFSLHPLSPWFARNQFRIHDEFFAKACFRRSSRPLREEFVCVQFKFGFNGENAYGERGEIVPSKRLSTRRNNRKPTERIVEN